MAASSPCSHPSCRRVTRDPSRRCHDHRSAALPRSPQGLPPPVVSAEEKYTKRFDERNGDPLTIEQWTVGGTLHRLDGPAFIATEPSGALRVAIYYRNGQTHRIDGPAIVDPEIGDEWYFSSAALTGPDALVRLLRGFPKKRVREELMGSSYRELLAEGRKPNQILDLLEQGVTTVDGMREAFSGAPVEWVRSYEEGKR